MAIYYHAAPKRRRNGILHRGIRVTFELLDETGIPGIYLAGSFEEAKAHAFRLHDSFNLGRQIDIYEVYLPETVPVIREAPFYGAYDFDLDLEDGETEVENVLVRIDIPKNWIKLVATYDVPKNILQPVGAGSR